MERRGSDPLQPEGRNEIGYRPLYRQVYETLLKRLADASWPPGRMLPSEGQLATELGVSQGTVRKALDALTADNLLVRRQGRGTFVAEHDDKQSVFRFFKLRSRDGGSGMPTSRVIALSEVDANPAERERLGLTRNARVVRIERLRSIDERPCVAETISIPVTLFPGMQGLELPNTLYSLYATQFGITISKANERLRAIAIDARRSELLGVADGTPVLEIDRIAIDLEERLVEWRVSICLTSDIYYLSLLR